MFGVSLLYTLAYALSITRYKLMQVEEIINRSVVYFAGQRDGGAALLGRCCWSAALLIGDQLLGQPDVARGGGGGGVGDRGPDPLGAGARAVPEGDRPAVLPREVQVRPGDAEDAAGGRQPGRPRRRWAAGCWRRRPRSCGWSGGRSTWPTPPAGRSGWRPATARRPTSRRSPRDNPLVDRLRQVAGGPASRTRWRWRRRPTRRPTP